MKTQQEVEAMIKQKQRDIDHIGERARGCSQSGNIDMFEKYDREYAKAVAQYNILLEVLK